MLETTGERRRAPRARYEKPIMLRTVSGAVAQATSNDVSELGMGLRAAALDHGGKPLWLTFSLPRVPHMIQLKARVVRQQPGAEGLTLGLRFLETPPVVRRMIRTYVHTGRGRVKEYEPPLPATP
jgi:c-di-GMP-binding flagellar brake protein YcgR